MRNVTYIRALGRLPFAPVENGEDSGSNNGSHDATSAGPANATADGLLVEGEIRTSPVATPPGANTSRSRSDGNPLHPARILRNQLTAAQNDVLATVGVCLRESAKNGPETRTALFVKENEMGLLIGAVDLTVGFLVNWPLVNIRNRLQTFRPLKHISYPDIVRSIWKNEGIMGFYAGMVTNLGFQILNIGCDYVQSTFLKWLSRTRIFRNPETGEFRKYSVRSLLLIDAVMNFIFWHMIQPLYRYSTLQELQLLPPMPLLPPVRTVLSAFSTEPLFESWSANGWWFLRPFNNYSVVCFLEQVLYQKLQMFVFKNVRRRLPRPDNPDRASLDAAYVDEFSDIEDEEERRRQRRRRRRAGTWGTRRTDGAGENSQSSRGVLQRLGGNSQSGLLPLSREEQQQIYNQAVQNGLEVIFDTDGLHIRDPDTDEQTDYLMEQLFPAVGGRLSGIAASPVASTEIATTPADINSGNNTSVSTSTTLTDLQTSSVPSTNEIPTSRSEESNSSSRDVPEQQTEGISTTVVQTEEGEQVVVTDLASLPPIHTHTPPPEATAVARPSIVVPPRASSLSAPTVAATIGSLPQTPGILSPLLGTSASSRNLRRSDRLRHYSTPANSQSLHRLTTLSCHPCDAAASHIADMVSAGVYIGIENIVLRSLARQFVRRQGGVVRIPGVGPVTTNDIYGAWGWKALYEGSGGVLKALIVDYGFSWLLWEVNMGIIEQLGKRMFGYRRNSMF